MNLFAIGKENDEVIDLTYSLAGGLFVDNKKSEATKRLIDVAEKTHDPRAMVELIKHSYAYKENEHVRKLASEIANEVVIEPNGVYLKALVQYNNERESFIQKHEVDLIEAIKCKNIFKNMNNDYKAKLDEMVLKAGGKSFDVMLLNARIKETQSFYSKFENMIGDSPAETSFWLAYQGFMGSAKLAHEMGEELDSSIYKAKAYLINQEFRFEKDCDFNLDEFETMALESNSPKAIYYANKCRFANSQFEDIKVPFEDIYASVSENESSDELSE